MELLNSFKRFLMKSVPEIVVKNSRTASAYETMTSRVKGDVYCDSVLGTDSFVTYKSFQLSSLERAGFTDVEQIAKIMENKYEIPVEKRDEVMKYEREYIVETYDEENEYYRILSGIPPYQADPSTYLYMSSTLIQIYELDDSYQMIPLHKLSQTLLNAMDNDGYLDELQLSYPDLPYISYLGNRRIDIVTARMSNHYDILYFPKYKNADRFHRDFIDCYVEAQEYILTNIYNYTMAGQYEYYDGYMGFIMLTATVGSMINNLFKIMVERDFYDLDTIRVFYESYHVPFSTIFTLAQQKIMVKNLNILLREKHTTKVLYHTLTLLGYDEIQISKYVLVKQHKVKRDNVESDLEPVFIYKVMMDDYGNPYLQLDKSALYDYWFVRVNMDETDIKVKDNNDADSYTYEEITVDDATWLEDDELQEALERDFNYMETKYAAITITYNMYKMMFELTYIGRMILDKKSETTKIMIDIPSLVKERVSLFDIQLFLICILCKRNGISPNILYSPSKILYILGFNFEADLEAIKEDIQERHNKEIYDQRILKYLNNIIFTTPDDVNKMFANIRTLEEFLSSQMQETSSYKVYNAYRKLYNTIFIEKLNTDLYQLSDGTSPAKFSDTLKERNYNLYQVYNKATKEECIDLIDYITTKLSTMLVDTKYFGYLDQLDERVIDGILRMLRFFKSYTIDIKNVDPVLIFDDASHNMLKLLSTMQFDVTLNPIEIWNRFLESNILLVNAGLQENTYMIQKDGMNFGPITLHARQDLKAESKLSIIEECLLMDKYSFRFFDNPTMHSTVNVSERFRLSDNKHIQFIWDE